MLLSRAQVSLAAQELFTGLWLLMVGESETPVRPSVLASRPRLPAENKAGIVGDTLEERSA